MERAARTIKNNKYSKEVFSEEDLALAAWAEAVGKAISAHTNPYCLVRDKLVVGVEDAIWQRQLHSLSQQILARLHKLTGSQAIQQLEFRIGMERRGVQRATKRESSAADGQDEAEAIRDPVLKKIYRLSRKRATA